MNSVCTETQLSTQMYSRGAQFWDTVRDSNEWRGWWSGRPLCRGPPRPPPLSHPPHPMLLPEKIESKYSKYVWPFAFLFPRFWLFWFSPTVVVWWISSQTCRHTDINTQTQTRRHKHTDTHVLWWNSLMFVLVLSSQDISELHLTHMSYDEHRHTSEDTCLCLCVCVHHRTCVCQMTHTCPMKKNISELHLAHLCFF